jgi:hypothetical protein
VIQYSREALVINGEAAAYWIARSSRATTIVFVAAELTSLEHDPESGNRFSERIMLKQRDEIMI